jgi:hypothetical protein
MGETGMLAGVVGTPAGAVGGVGVAVGVVGTVGAGVAGTDGVAGVAGVVDAGVVEAGVAGGVISSPKSSVMANSERAKSGGGDAFAGMEIGVEGASAARNAA